MPQLLRNNHLIAMSRTANISRLLVLFVFFSFACFVIQLATGGYISDRGNHADEAAHFVSSLAIADYVKNGHLAPPVAFAQNYYQHFPKLAIGHWPPVYEVLQALFFLIFGGAGVVAIAFQAVIAGFCVAITVGILAPAAGLIESFFAGFVLLLSPAVLPLVDMVMSDILLAVTVTWAAFSWGRFYERRDWKWGVLFAVASATAILTKGSAFGLALMPLIYFMLKRDFSFLLNAKLIVSGLIVAVLTLPWYILTYQMAADGFVFKWGWDYIRQAAPFFSCALVFSIGLPLVLFYVMGLFLAAKNVGQSKIDITAYAASSLAMLLFAMIVPADLDRRYLVPALPSILIVSVVTLVWTVQKAMQRFRIKIPPALVTSLILLGSIALVFSVPVIRSFHADRLVRDIMQSRAPNMFVLVSGNVQEEGAFISSFAEKDKALRYYTIRAQKALARTNWMATSYELKFATAEEVAQWIERNNIGWLIIDTDEDKISFPHNSLLKSAIDKGLLQTKLVDVSVHPGGQMALYSLPNVDKPFEMTDEIMSTLEPGHLEGFIK